MLKRTFISLLAVLLIMAATTSVFAFNYPTNDQSVTSTLALDINFKVGSTITSDSVAQVSLPRSGSATRLHIGFMNNGNTVSSSDMSVNYFHVTFTISVPCDIYIVSPVNSVQASVASGSLGSAGLYSHWDSSSTITYDHTIEGSLVSYTYMIDLARNTSSTAYNSTSVKDISCYFLKFNDVPVGTYTYYYPPSSFTCYTGIFEGSLNIPTGGFTIPFGLYLAEVQTPSGGGGSGGDDSSGSSGGIDQTYLDSWIDPSASLQQNITNIQNTLNEAVAGSDEPDVQTFYAIYANYQLDLLQKENDLNFTNTVNNVETGFSQVINDYIAGNISYADALDDLSDSYVDSLADCETPEQGSYLTAVYQAKQTQLHYKAVDLAGEVIKDVITDEELENADDYYEAEEALISQFELQNLQDTVKFQEWYNLLGSAEALTYKSIFDWFLNTSSFKYWLIIPLSMIVITNLLGTVLYVSRHRAYNSRYSDRGNKND